MKRYVREFANDIIRSFPEGKKVELKARITKFVRCHERGIITGREAVNLICYALNEDMERENQAIDNVIG